MNNNTYLSLPNRLHSCLVSGSDLSIARACTNKFLSQKTPDTTAIAVDFTNNSSGLQDILQDSSPVVFCIDISYSEYMSLFTEDGYDSIDKIYQYFEHAGLNDMQRDSMKHSLQVLEEISILQGNGRLTLKNYLRLHTSTAMTNAIQTLLIQGRITSERANEWYSTLAQCAKDLLPLENALASMKYHQNAVQSVTDIPDGSAALFYVSQSMNAKNKQLLYQLKTDITYRARRGKPLLLIFNVGTCIPLSTMKNLLADIQYQRNVEFIYITPDVFGSCDEKESVEQFLNIFDYNVYSRHGGDSAKKLSQLFGEHIVYESSSSETKDLRLFSASITDLILRRNRSITTSYSPSMRAYVPVSWIINMEGGILYNTATKEYTFC